MSGYGDNHMISRALYNKTSSGLNELKKWAKEQYTLQVSKRPKKSRDYLILHKVWSQVIDKLNSM